MYKKVYLSRAQTRAMATEYPIGDPTGGAAYGEYNDPVSAAIMGVASIGGALISGDAATNAAQTQADAARQQQANLLAAGQVASQQFTPYANYGTTALSNLASNNAYFNNQFSNADLNSNLAPNYAFQLQQGTTGAAQQANATGGLVGGNAQQALNTFGQNYAGNAYQQAFNNYQAQRGNIAAQNMAGANLGLSGATGSANAQLGTATNIANLGIGAANATAAGQLGQAQAYSSGLSSLGNIAALNGMMSNSQPQTSAGLMSSIGASGGSGQYFGSNSNGLGAGQGYSGMNFDLGLA
jgi:hypothetical protein